MKSIPLREVLKEIVCLPHDRENLVYGDLDSTMANVTKLLLELLAESEVERRTGARLHERGETRTDHRNGYRHR